MKHTIRLLIGSTVFILLEMMIYGFVFIFNNYWGIVQVVVETGATILFVLIMIGLLYLIGYSIEQIKESDE